MRIKVQEVIKESGMLYENNLLTSDGVCLHILLAASKSGASEMMTRFCLRHGLLYIDNSIWLWNPYFRLRINREKFLEKAYRRRRWGD